MTNKNTVKIPWADALDLKQTNDGEFAADYPSDFCYGIRAHGGLLISFVTRAVRIHFEDSLKRPNLGDVLDLKTHFLRMVTAGPISMKIEDLFVSKRNATVEARVFQEGKLSLVFLISVGNLSQIKGPSFETNWRLDPPPQPVEISRLANDSDPNWISWQSHWHAKSYTRVMSHAKFFFPYKQDPDRSIRDQWMTPVDADPNFGWTNELLGYVSDLTFSPLENYQFEKGVASHENMIEIAKAQRSARETGKQTMTDSKGVSPFSAFTSFTTSLNLEIKKMLPKEGVKWLFTRTRSMLAKDGHMDWNVTIHDESGELVAVAYIIHQIVASSDIPQPTKKAGKSKM